MIKNIRINVIVILTLILFSNFGYGQHTNKIIDFKSISLDSVHPKIKLLLSKNEKWIKKIIKKSDSKLTIIYGDELFEREVRFNVSDSLIEVNDYELKVFLGIDNSRLIILDTTKIKEEITLNTDEISVYSFNIEGHNKYTDHCLENTYGDTSDFGLGFVLCDMSNKFVMEIAIVWPYQDYVNIDDFVFNNDLKVYLAFFGANVGMKKIENPYPWVDRYRLILFRLDNLKLAASIIVSGMR